MFKKLVSQKNPVVPTEEIRCAVENILGESFKYWNYASNLEEYMCDDAQKAKKGYEEAIGIYLLMQKTVAKIIDIWPEGRNLVKEIQEVAKIGMVRTENDYNCMKYLHTTNSEDPEYLYRARGFSDRRHQYAPMIDNKLHHISEMIISSKINKE